MESNLIISRGGFPPLSARGCVQTLTPIATGQFKRTVNGDLIFLGVQGKKYRSVISCKDKAVLATGDLEPGTEIEVQCIQRLWQRGQDGEVTLEHDHVPGALAAVSEARKPVSVVKTVSNKITVASSDVVFVSYRPILKMRVIKYTLRTDEWGLCCEWELELEEI